MNPLLRLRELGQSPWHDNIQRSLLTGGQLRRMVEDGDITGLTSNPTIFEQAIGQSSDYDDDLRRFAAMGKSAEEIFDALAIDDIRRAADVFAPVFERSGGRDGFVSIEVAPKFANDTQATIYEARRLWSAVSRPNLMVKIPATPAGVPAIEQAIADGLNVNVTLIFSLRRYDEVMDAYLRGLMRRIESGQQVDRSASVASFFVSRVDTLVDKLLDEKLAAGAERRDLLQGLKGKAAIANAKLAYADFRRKFSTEGHAALMAHGAHVQRPLWASTSTKNPAYPDVYYVEALVGPETVDTMPPATLAAYKDHGKPEVRLDKKLDEARRVMDQLAEVGIDMDAVTRKLEADGVAAFAKSYDSLIATVEKRRQSVARRPVAPAAKAAKAKPAPKRPARAARPKRETGAKRAAGRGGKGPAGPKPAPARKGKAVKARPTKRKRVVARARKAERRGAPAAARTAAKKARPAKKSPVRGKASKAVAGTAKRRTGPSPGRPKASPAAKRRKRPVR